MHRMLGLAAALAVAFTASLASAEEITGAIGKIDLSANTFMVGDKLFAASPDNTVGAKLSELKEGDKVTVVFTEETHGDNPINAMELKKAE